MNRADIYQHIDAERDRQHQMWERAHAWGWGDCSSQAVHPMVKVAVLTEETGEVARAVTDQDDQDLKTELIQTAAVCVAWLESL